MGGGEISIEPAAEFKSFLNCPISWWPIQSISVTIHDGVSTFCKADGNDDRMLILFDRKMRIGWAKAHFQNANQARNLQNSQIRTSKPYGTSNQSKVSCLELSIALVNSRHRWQIS